MAFAAIGRKLPKRLCQNGVIDFIEPVRSHSSEPLGEPVTRLRVIGGNRLCRESPNFVLDRRFTLTPGLESKIPRYKEARRYPRAAVHAQSQIPDADKRAHRHRFLR